MQEMATIRQQILSKPGVLQELVQQLREGSLEQKAQSAEMLFCVVGQGPSADNAAIQQAGPCSHTFLDALPVAFWSSHSLHVGTPYLCYVDLQILFTWLHLSLSAYTVLFSLLPDHVVVLIIAHCCNSCS